MVHFIGLDIHRKETVACIYNAQTREERYVTLPSDEDEVAAFVQSQPFSCKVAFEVGGHAGRFYDRLRPVCEEVLVSNPSQMPWLYRTPNKSDRLDSKKQAILLSVGQLPTVHMPPVNVRQWRQLIKHRQRLMQQRNRVQNRIRAMLHSEGIRRTARGKWWTQKNIRWITQQLEPLSELSALLLESQLAQLALLNEQVKRITQELDVRGQDHAGVALLRTIPGVGPRTAEALVAFADDIQRFARSREFAAYFGLVPRLDASADRLHRGHISKQGPSVARWLLGQSAWRAVRDDKVLKAFFERVQHGQKQRKKIAIVAVARKLTTIACAMLRTGEEYNQALVSQAPGVN